MGRNYGIKCCVGSKKEAAEQACEYVSAEAGARFEEEKAEIPSLWRSHVSLHAYPNNSQQQIWCTAVYSLGLTLDTAVPGLIFLQP